MAFYFPSPFLSTRSTIAYRLRSRFRDILAMI
jgi:hypothetical protein